MANSCSCGRCPCIIVPGIGQSKVIEIDGDGKKIRNLWPFDFDPKPVIKKLTVPALAMLITRHDCGFSKRVGRCTEQALEPLSCNPDSTRRHNVQVVSYPYPLSRCSEDERRYIYKMVPLQRLAQAIGEDHLYFFSYDIFGRTERNAELLRDFIRMVKRQTGHEKVNLIPVSMGATVTEMYFALYGDDRDVYRVVGVVPAYDGSTVVSDLMAGNLNLDNYENLFITLLGNKDGTKINGALSHVPEKVVRSTVSELLQGALRAVLLNSSAMWGLVPSKDYPLFRDSYLADDAHSDMRKYTDMHWEARRGIKELVSREQERGVEFFNICGCGVRLFEAVASGDVSSDMIVPVFSSSMGAECAPLGGHFSEKYEQKSDSCAGHNHISPSGDIDASCCAVPDRTWFYYNMEHEQAAENEALLTLVQKLLSSDEISDVYSSPEYPQFNIFEKQ